MKPETHFNRIIGQASVQSWVLFIFFQLLGNCYRSDDFNKRNNCQIAHLANILQIFEYECPRLKWVRIVILRPELPNKQKRIADIFICRTTILIDCSMDYCCNLIDKHHHTLLKNFCCISEISNIAKSENGHHFFTRYHRVDFASFAHISSNDFRSCFPKTDCQQSPNFNDQAFQYLGFHCLFFF